MSIYLLLFQVNVCGLIATDVCLLFFVRPASKNSTTKGCLSPLTIRELISQFNSVKSIFFPSVCTQARTLVQLKFRLHCTYSRPYSILHCRPHVGLFAELQGLPCLTLRYIGPHIMGSLHCFIVLPYRGLGLTALQKGTMMTDRIPRLLACQPGFLTATLPPLLYLRQTKA